MIKLEMKNYSAILKEKQQKYKHYYQVKYEYFTGEKVIPYDQSRITEQATSTYSALVKAFEERKKTIEDHRKILGRLKTMKSN